MENNILKVMIWGMEVDVFIGIMKAERLTFPTRMIF